MQHAQDNIAEILQINMQNDNFPKNIAKTNLQRKLLLTSSHTFMADARYRRPLKQSTS